MTNINSTADSYLTNMPDNMREYGISKVLFVRKEVINIKHIMTEIFQRKSILIEPMLDNINITVFDYMSIMTTILRNVHKISRKYSNNLDHIVKEKYNDFFPYNSMLTEINNVIILDFDGVVTDNNFIKLYNLCLERSNVIICSANPTVSNEWFKKKNLKLPNKIYACKGKVNKIIKLIEIAKKYEIIQYVDNEIEYLKYAWLFNIKTYYWDKKTIKFVSFKTK